MLSIKDIVDLAKAGYSVSDVKELISLSKEDDKTDPVPDDTPGPEGDSNEDTPKDAKESPSQEDPKDEKDEEEPDYKALYEKTQKELEEAQKANRNKDRSSEDDYKSDEDKFKELVSQFIN